jgi:ABC-type polysaccharide/polyol phosphate export permease
LESITGMSANYLEKKHAPVIMRAMQQRELDASGKKSFLGKYWWALLLLLCLLVLGIAGALFLRHRNNDKNKKK